MKRKLDTRFPAVRIKKIMQADEDVGKIAMAVPLLVSKALELFLQDLCDRTYEITINKGAKTVNSLHLKQCVRSFNSFDFLKDTVSKVHDLGGSDAVTDDKSTIKKRKFSEDEDDNNDESGRVRMHEPGHVSSNRRGRGRPRGRGRGRSSRALEREMVVQYKETEEATQSSHQNDENQKEKLASHDYVAVDADPGTTSREDEDKLGRNFDLNVELNANDDSTPPAAAASVPSEPSSKPLPVVKYEDIPGWPVDHVERIAIDPIQLANLNIKMDEEDEDYDEE